MKWKLIHKSCRELSTDVEFQTMMIKRIKWGGKVLKIAHILLQCMSKADWIWPTIEMKVHEFTNSQLHKGLNWFQLKLSKGTIIEFCSKICALLFLTKLCNVDFDAKNCHGSRATKNISLFVTIVHMNAICRYSYDSHCQEQPAEFSERMLFTTHVFLKK